ncbi:MAG: hypothetical protein IT473_06655 [Lysobacter sp.]|nr:hypothetical protein [Lysobacter sp.]
MSVATVTSTPPRARIVAPAFFAAIGILGMTAIWVIVALIRDRQCAWMAAIAAADIAFLLRLGRAAPGAQRATIAVLSTVVTILAANWCIASTQMGLALGFGFIDSTFRLGTHLAWTLTELANSGAEWAWYAVALPIAYWLGK